MINEKKKSLLSDEASEDGLRGIPNFRYQEEHDCSPSSLNPIPLASADELLDGHDKANKK
jgi:hypothetical protein